MTNIDQTALLAAIADDPADDLPRLAYADWLEENGHTDRSTHLRAQLEMARLPEDSPRRNALEHKSRLLEVKNYQWNKPLDKLGCDRVTYNRGFPHEAAMRTHYFLSNAEALSAEPNLGVTVDISQWAHHLQALAELPSLERFPRLRLTGKNMGDAAAGLIAAQPGFQHLTGLALGDAITDEGMRALIGSPHLTNLTELDLSKNTSIREGTIAALASSPHFARLTDLNLQDIALFDEAATALVQSPHMAKLRRLNLRSTIIGDQTIRALADESCPVRNLQSLNLCSNLISGEGIEALAASPNARHLTELDVSYPCTPLTLTSLEAIAQSPHLANLRRLNLNGYGNLGLAGIEALAASPTLKNLHRLSLSGFGMSDTAAKTLAESPVFSNLTRLDLSSNRFGNEGALALAKSPYLANLETLDISGGITDEGLLALAKGLPKLTRLEYSRGNIGHHTARQIDRILDNRRQGPMR